MSILCGTSTYQMNLVGRLPYGCYTTGKHQYLQHGSCFPPLVFNSLNRQGTGLDLLQRITPIASSRSSATTLQIDGLPMFKGDGRFLFSNSEHLFTDASFPCTSARHGSSSSFTATRRGRQLLHPTPHPPSEGLARARIAWHRIALLLLFPAQRLQNN